MGSMWEYLEKRRFFARTGPALEEVAASELEELGAEDLSPSYRGVYFSAQNPTLYRILLLARIPSRILAPLASFPCFSDDQLYKRSTKLAWNELLSPEKTFRIFADLSGSRIKNSHFAVQRLKDAVADHFVRTLGKRPSVAQAEDFPDLWLHLLIQEDRALLSLDVAGGALHRRGYRKEGGDAPLQETLAAAIVRLSGWKGETPLYDPFCGSGTLLAEALMSWCRIPNSLFRSSFGLSGLPDFDAPLWEESLRKANEESRSLPEGLLSGSDVSPEAVKRARRNLSSLPCGERVSLKSGDFRTLEGLADRTLLCNPPYGVRLGETEKLKTLYKEFGDFLKRRCPRSTAWILCGNRELIPSLGLRPSRKIPLFNGPLEGRLVKLEIRPLL